MDAYDAEWVGAENVVAEICYPWQWLLVDTRHRFRYKNHRSPRRRLGCLEGAESARYHVDTDTQYLVEVNIDMQYSVEVDSEVEVKFLSPERPQNRGANID